MIRLSLRALSLYGKKLTNAIRANEQTLNMHCSCPPGQSCNVEVNELPGRRFEVLVTRPGPVIESYDWVRQAPSVVGKYQRLFERRTSAARVRDSLAKIVGAPLVRESGTAVDSSTDTPNIVLVDSFVLEKLERLIVGCQVCSPNAEFPFGRIVSRAMRSTTRKTHYMLERSVNCPRCSREVTQDTGVEVDFGR